MSAWDERALAHLEVVQGLPGQGLPPELDEHAQEQQQEQHGKDRGTAGDTQVAQGGAPADKDRATPPPTPPQGPPSPPGAAKAAPGTGAKPEKNPTQELMEFYNRFKGQRIASFDRPGDPEDLKRPWICTIHLSGGRINDKQSLGEYTFTGQDRTKKGSEAAASKAAMDHLKSLGLANAETLASQSNKQERWHLPRRRLPDSTLVCFELSAGAQAGDLMPTGQIVIELFHDVAPKTLANLRRAFGLGNPPLTHSALQSSTTTTITTTTTTTNTNTTTTTNNNNNNDNNNCDISNTNNDNDNKSTIKSTDNATSNITHPTDTRAPRTLESHPVPLDDAPPGPGTSSNGAHSSSQTGNVSNGVHSSSRSNTASNGVHSSQSHTANGCAASSSQPVNTTQNGSSACSSSSSSAAQACGYVGCKVAHPLSNYRVSFTPPTRTHLTQSPSPSSAPPPSPSPPSSSSATAAAGAAATAAGEPAQNGDGTMGAIQPHSDGGGGGDAVNGKVGGSGNEGDGGASKGSTMPEKPAQDALASLLDMQEDMLGIAEGDEEGEDGEDQDLQDGVGSIEQQQQREQEEKQWAQQLQEQERELQREEQQEQERQQQQQQQQQEQQQQQQQQQQQGLANEQTQQEEQGLQSCLDEGEANDSTRLLRHDRAFRVSLPREPGSLEESASLSILTSPMPAFNETHFVIGQVVRGFGMVRQLESLAAGHDVLHGIYGKPGVQTSLPYTISSCSLLPQDAKLEDVPVLMDGEWPSWPDDLAPTPPGTTEAQRRLSIAEALRTQANHAFKNGDWHGAARKYSQALRFLNLRSLADLSTLKYSHKVEIQNMQCRSWLNRSAAAVRLGQGQAAMADAREVLQLCPEGHALVPKALYRLAHAMMVLSRHEEAVETLQHALQQAGPNNADLRASLATAKQELKQQRAREGAAYAKGVQGWCRGVGSGGSNSTKAAKKAEFDGGEFDGASWLLNPNANRVIERLGAGAPFRGMHVNGI